MVKLSYRCPKQGCHHEAKWRILKQHMASCCPDQPFTQRQLQVYDPLVVAAKNEQNRAKAARRSERYNLDKARSERYNLDSSRMPCRFYFSSPGGCRNGDRCRFSHAAEDDPRIYSNSGWASHNSSSNFASPYPYPYPYPPPPSSWVADPSLPPRQEERPDDRTTSSILPHGGYGELLLARMRNQEGTGTDTGTGTGGS